jgi:hypothetical protein
LTRPRSKLIFAMRSGRKRNGADQNAYQALRGRGRFYA